MEYKNEYVIPTDESYKNNWQVYVKLCEYLKNKFPNFSIKKKCEMGMFGNICVDKTCSLGDKEFVISLDADLLCVYVKSNFDMEEIMASFK